MKKNRVAIISLLAIVLFFNSCNEKRSSHLNGKNYYLKVNIDGIEHSFNKSVFVNASPLKLGLIAINPNDGNGKNMAIAISSKDVDVTGTFTNEFTAVFLKKGQAGAWDADRNSRTITITENNDTFIEGTFSFTGHNLKDDTTKEFTQGSFRARKPKQKK